MLVYNNFPPEKEQRSHKNTAEAGKHEKARTVQLGTRVDKTSETS
jgi:hypothetical protein